MHRLQSFILFLLVTLLLVLPFASATGTAAFTVPSLQPPRRANASIVSAAATSFCKCTCKTNSTIIPLDRDPTTDTSEDGKAPTTISINTPNPAHHKTCADCTKAFCLSYNLAICKDVADDDVFTTCFQRDSTKDELVVFIFIFATLGLLVWAAVRPYVAGWRQGERAADRGAYGRVEG